MPNQPNQPNQPNKGGRPDDQGGRKGDRDAEREPMKQPGGAQPDREPQRTPGQGGQGGKAPERGG